MDQFRDLARGGTAPHISRSELHAGDASPIGRGMHDGWYADVEWGMESYSRPSLSRGSNQLAELNNALRNELTVQSATPTHAMYASAPSPDGAPWHTGDGDLSPRSSPLPSSTQWGSTKRPPTSTRSHSSGFRGSDIHPGSPHLFTARGDTRDQRRDMMESPRR